MFLCFRINLLFIWFIHYIFVLFFSSTILFNFSKFNCLYLFYFTFLVLLGDIIISLLFFWLQALLFLTMILLLTFDCSFYLVLNTYFIFNLTTIAIRFLVILLFDYFYFYLIYDKISNANKLLLNIQIPIRNH